MGVATTATPCLPFPFFCRFNVIFQKVQFLHILFIGLFQFKLFSLFIEFFINFFNDFFHFCVTHISFTDKQLLSNP